MALNVSGGGGGSRGLVSPPLGLFGEVWAGWGRDQEALKRLLPADIRAISSGPDLPGMVIRVGHHHYVFVDDLLAGSAPILHKVVLAHETAHIMRGVGRDARCQT